MLEFHLMALDAIFSPFRAAMFEVMFGLHEHARIFGNFVLNAGMRRDKRFQLRMFREEIRIGQQCRVFADFFFQSRMLVHEVIERGQIGF